MVEEGGEEGGALGSLFGRVDVSAKITKEFLADMANDGGLVDRVDQGVVDLTKSLMAHLSDSNANLTTKAVHVIGVVVASAGPSMAKLANLVVGVADNKKAMRAFVAAVRDDGAQDPVGRAELLGWTVEMTQTVAGKMDLRSLVETTIDALSDKSTAVRHKAKLLLVELFKSVGRDAVQVGYGQTARTATTAFGGGDVERKPTKPPAAAAVSSSSYFSSLVKNVPVRGGRTAAPSPKANLSCPSASKPTSPKQRYTPFGQLAREPSSMYKSSQLKQLATPLKSQTATSIPSTSSVFPPPTMSSPVKLPLPSSSSSSGNIPASSSPKDTLLLFVPLERLVMRQGLTVIPGELKAGKDAVKSLYSRSSIGDDVFIQEKPRQRDRRPCVAGARRGVWHMASLCVVTISSTFRHAPYVGRV
ncbi:hypothetical protein H257_03657 [Aphanomyces astaci]|uniref:TOG domain-containing protein n=1 Tax=Aphanomyces astaci TaxID=112090 RepID=W4GXJ9_APHAT|nr:hypothetical protein H257_03657 [Aphanomyces astaci]ETV84455.1 hypothetical protein H257_03657 [Aphanomyces astaci]|eukprot:XP_009826147.1 hypothetical protein H257_03657 [Aphanomyces astaci]